jgi:hypothetical protein
VTVAPPLQYVGHIYLAIFNSLYVVASKRSLIHFISEKYKTVPSFKLLFLQNSPLLQLYTSANDCKGVGIVPGSHFMKAFSALPSHS